MRVGGRPSSINIVGSLLLKVWENLKLRVCLRRAKAGSKKERIKKYIIFALGQVTIFMSKSFESFIQHFFFQKQNKWLFLRVTESLNYSTDLFQNTNSIRNRLILLWLSFELFTLNRQKSIQQHCIWNVRCSILALLLHNYYYFFFAIT